MVFKKADIMTIKEIRQKLKEFESILPLMEELGYDQDKAKKDVLCSEQPDFIFKSKNIGIEVTVCHPDITKGENAKNIRAAMQRTTELCNFLEKSLNNLGEVVNCNIRFNFGLLFELQHPKLPKCKKNLIQCEVLLELLKRIYGENGNMTDDICQEFDKKQVKKCHYISDIELNTPSKQSSISYSYPARSAAPIEPESVLKAISCKEDKLCCYRESNPKIKEFWLCVNIPMGVDRTIDGLENLKIESQYDRIYITWLDKFKRLK